jgi:hypothetical protein
VLGDSLEDGLRRFNRVSVPGVGVSGGGGDPPALAITTKNADMATTRKKPTKTAAPVSEPSRAIMVSPGVEILPAESDGPGSTSSFDGGASEPADFGPPPPDHPDSYPGGPNADPVMALAITPHPGTAEGRLARRTKALELRIEGKGYHEIAALLGVTYKTAYYDVQESLVHLGRYHTHLAEDVRTVELARLDVMTQALWPAVLKGSTYHIDTALKVMSRRAAMLGLDFKDQEAGREATTPVPGRDLHHMRQTAHKLSNEELQQRLQVLRARVDGFQAKVVVGPTVDPQDS